VAIRPPAADLPVSSVRLDSADFVDISQRKNALRATHSHGFTCEKPPKGLYMCRLAMPRGTHEADTCAQLIAMHQRPNRANDRRSVLEGLLVDRSTVQMLVGPYLPLHGELICQHPVGPVVW
jgi:hypothetical protein